MTPFKFSDKVEQMKKELWPYFDRYPNGMFKGGIREDSPPEIKELYKKFQEQVEEESWY